MRKHAIALLLLPEISITSRKLIIEARTVLQDSEKEMKGEHVKMKFNQPQTACKKKLQWVLLSY